MKENGPVPDILLSMCIISWESRIRFDELKKLHLDICTTDVKQTSALNAFLRSCPHLQELRLDVKKPHWKTESSEYVQPFYCPTQCLDKVELIGLRGYEYEMSILKFVQVKQGVFSSELTKEECNGMAFLEKYSKDLPDKCSYSSLIQILSSAELPHKAASYLKRMQHVGFVNDCIPFSMVTDSFAKFGDLQRAEDVFREMVGFSLQPDVVVYSVLINAFAEVGNVSQATNYVKLMKGAGFEVNYIICNSLIKLFTKVGYLQEARETYELVKALGDIPDMYSSNCMIDLYCENSMVHEAEEVFWNLKRRGEANEFSNAMMLCLYKKTGKLNEAYQVVQEMKELGLLTEALSYNNVMSLYASDGRMKEAVLCFQEMLTSGVQPNDATFKLLGVVLLKRGASKEAIKYLELVRKNNAQSGLQEWVKSLCSLVRLDDNFSKFGGKLKIIVTNYFSK